MKRSRFTQEQIIGVLKEHQAGAAATDLCRKHGVGDATFYKWRSKYGGMVALDDPPHLGAEPAIIVGKLRLRGWPEPSVEERSAVRAAFLAAWVSALGQADADALRWLEGLGAMGSVADALELWRRSPSPHAVWHLAQLAYAQGRRLWDKDAKGYNAVDGGFWGHAAPEVREGVMAWLRSADVWRWLDGAAPPTDPYDNWVFEEARNLLRPSGEPG